MRTLGIVMIIAGVMFFVFDSIDFKRDKKVLDLGSIEVTSRETESIPLNKVAGGVIILAGLGIVLYSSKKSWMPGR